MSAKWAFKFGGMEHRFSRVLFLFLVTTYLVSAYTFGVDAIYSLEAPLLVWFIRIDIILWILYWACHILEKRSFKHNR